MLNGVIWIIMLDLFNHIGYIANTNFTKCRHRSSTLVKVVILILS